MVPFILAMPVLSFDFKPQVEQALRNARMTQDDLSALMGIEAPQLSNQIASREHLSVQRCIYAMRSKAGQRFLGELALLVCERMGIESPMVRTFAVLTRLEWSLEAMGLGKFRMARAVSKDRKAVS